MVPSSLGLSLGRPVPDDEDLLRAAAVFNAGTKVAIQVGQGARGAEIEIAAVAEVLGAGVSKALLGKDVLSDDLPWVTGANGLPGTRPSYELMRDCDTLLVVGSSFPYSQYLPEFGAARGVQIDSDPSMLGMRYPFEVTLHVPLLARKTDRAWREIVEEHTARWWTVLERRALVGADPINPERVFHEPNPLLPETALLTADSGSVATWYARHLRIRGEMRGSLSGTLTTMGCALPYAVGAKFAHPDRPVVALVGDGAMQMNGLSELISVQQHRSRWPDQRFVVGVLNNGDLNQVTWELRAMGGSPQFEVSQRLPGFPSADYARSLGMLGVRVEEPGDVRGAWEQALATDRPAVVEFVTDPAIPLIPPQVSVDQMQKTAQALLSGDPEAWQVVTRGLKSKAQELLP